MSARRVTLSRRGRRSGGLTARILAIVALTLAVVRPTPAHAQRGAVEHIIGSHLLHRFADHVEDGAGNTPLSAAIAA